MQPEPTASISSVPENASGSAGPAGADHPYRLPRTVVPRRYDLTLSPDLGQRDFVGSVEVELDIDPGQTSVAEIVANAIDLEILRAWVVNDQGTRIDATATLDATTERVTFALAHALTGTTARLHVEFHAPLSLALCGFYASTYVADDGRERVIATTQFESTDARRCFPCWDEPDLKAVFGVTLIVEDGLLAVSNGPAIEETRTASGKRRIRFADTMIMSSYLVCVVVGELTATQPVDVDGVDIRVICRPGREHLAQFALDTAAFSLRYFTDYYGLPYPDKKLDLLAIPDFSFGAMENVGAVTFRETLLLVDPATTSRAEQEVASDVISHEIAHMWFGNLVTMRWWNGLWLNEAFATFAEMSCTHAYHPEWRRWDGFAQMRAAALIVDALHATRPIEFPVISPSDAEGMFDVLTYEKGAAVLRMLEQHVGPERFRNGIRRYLSTHAHANTDTADLWDALEAETAVPVREVMDTWILQGGHPVITVEPGSTPTSIRISQQPFTTLPAAPPSQQLAGSPPATTPATRWHVPVRVRCAGDTTTQAVMLTSNETATEIDLGRPVAEAVIAANAYGDAVYRVRPTGVVRDQLLRHLPELEPGERFTSVFDSWGDAYAGHSTLADHLAMLRGLGATETDPNVWFVIATTLDAIARLLGPDPETSPHGPAFAALASELVSPACAALGDASRPGDGPFDGQLRALLLRAAALHARDAGAQARAEELLVGHLDGASIDADLLPTVAALGARRGDADRYDRYLQARATATTPQAEQRWLRTLAEFRPAPLVHRTLEFALSSEVRPADTPFVLMRALAHPEHGPVAWAFVKDRWADVSARLNVPLLVRTLSGIVECDAAADDIVSFLSVPRVSQGSLRQVAQHLERLQAWVAFAERERPRLAATLV